MRIVRRRTLSAALLMCLILAGAVGHTSASGPPNAADAYRRAIERFEASPDDARDVVDSFNRTFCDAAPDEAAREAFVHIRPAIEAMERGARRRHYDLGLPYEKGLAMRLPHLSHMRSIARAAKGEAQLQLYDGNAARAVQIWDAQLRMSDHVSRDEIVVSSLVANAIFTMVDDELKRAISRGELKREHASQLLETYELLDGDDPMRLTAAIVREQELLMNTVRQFESGELDIRETLAGFVGPAELNFAATSLASEEQAASEIKGLEEAGREVSDIVTSGLSTEQMNAELDVFTEDLRAGRYGRIAQSLMPAFSKAMENVQRTAGRIAYRRSVLEDIATGRLDAADLANAALYYDCAISRWRALEAEVAETVREVAASPQITPDKRQRAHLDQLDGVLRPLERAVSMSNCDFDELRPESVSRRLWMQVYDHEPLYDLAIVLLALSNDRVHAEEPDEALRRLDQLLAMTRHLTDDGTIAGAMLAAHLTERIVEPVESLIERDAVKAATRRAVQKRIRAIDDDDPFGAEGAMASTRELLHAFLVEHDALEDEVERREARQWLDSLGDVQLLHLLAGQPYRAGHVEAIAPARPLIVDRLDAVFDAEAFASSAVAGRMLMMQPHQHRYNMRKEQWPAEVAEAEPIVAIGLWRSRAGRVVDRLREAAGLRPVEAANEQADD